MKRLLSILMFLLSFAAFGQLTPNSPSTFNEGIRLPNISQNTQTDSVLTINGNGKVGYTLKNSITPTLQEVVDQGFYQDSIEYYMNDEAYPGGAFPINNYATFKSGVSIFETGYPFEPMEEALSPGDSLSRFFIGNGKAFISWDFHYGGGFGGGEASILPEYKHSGSLASLTTLPLYGFALPVPYSFSELQLKADKIKLEISTLGHGDYLTVDSDGYISSTNIYIPPESDPYFTPFITNNDFEKSIAFGKDNYTNNNLTRVTAFGHGALQNSTGERSVAIGYNALKNNTADFVYGLGNEVLINNAGEHVNGLGSSVLRYNTGDDVNGIGYIVLSGNSGNYVNGIGSAVLNDNTGHSVNGIGRKVLKYNSGNYVNGIGRNVLMNNAGDNVIGIGFNILDNNIGNSINVLGSNSFNTFYLDNSTTRTITSSDIIGDKIYIPNHGFGSVGEYILLSRNSSYVTRFKVIHADTLLNNSLSTVSPGTLTSGIKYNNINIIGNNIDPTRSNQSIMSGKSLVLPESTIAEINDVGAKAVITKEYADANYSSSPLEKITESGKTGYRLKNANPANYGDIGKNAIDLSISTVASSTFGATGESSFATGDRTAASYLYTFAAGDRTIANGYAAFASGQLTNAIGYNSAAFNGSTTASGTNSVAFGSQSIASGKASSAFNSGTTASGDFSTTFGIGSTAESYAEIAIGSFNTDYTPLSSTSFNASDRLFVIGNGTSSSNMSDALIVLKNGTITAPSLSNAEVNTAGTEAIPTVGWVQSQGYSSLNLSYTLPTADGSANQILMTDGNGNVSWSNNIIYDPKDIRIEPGTANIVLGNEDVLVIQANGVNTDIAIPSASTSNQRIITVVNQGTPLPISNSFSYIDNTGTTQTSIPTGATKIMSDGTNWYQIN